MKKAYMGIAAVLIVGCLVFLVWSNRSVSNPSVPANTVQNGVATTTGTNGTSPQAKKMDVSGFTYNQQKYVCPNQLTFTTLSNADGSKMLLIFSGPKPYSSAILTKVPAVNALRFQGGDKAFEFKLGGYAFTSGSESMRCTRG